MNFVIIPCWRNPAFLAATLHLIERARGANRHYYMFSVDRDAMPEIDVVIAGFKFLPASSIVKRKHSYVGNSCNVLEAYKSILPQLDPAELVYLIEDDVFVADDFFEFHEDAHRLDPETFFVAACQGHRKIFSKTVDEIIYRSSRYRSIGVSFKSYRLSSIAEHATRKYYANMIGYCARQFSDQWAFPTDVEQDQLIYRVVRKFDSYGIFPASPRCFHAGFVGYRRGGSFDQTDWRAKADELLTMTSDQMNELADPRFRDIERCELIRTRVPLRVV